MDLISICVYLIIGLFGVGYPILFQVMAGLDQKYNSVLVLNLFRREPERKWFIGFLIASLAAIFLWGGNFRAWSCLNFPIVIHSALYLSVTVTIGLIVFFFLFVQKILKYYSTIEFLNYLITKNNKAETQGDFRYFNAIADLLYFSVEKQNEGLALKISDYLYMKFKEKRFASADSPVIYPEDYYVLVYSTIEALGNVENTQFTFLGYRSAGGIWLIGELDDVKISAQTYAWLWKNIQLSLKYKRPDFIIYYWQCACQHFSFQLQRIAPQYGEDLVVLNIEDVEARDKERDKFLEMNFALGGLLLYQKQYDCIKRVFAYTSSIPPDYVLLPNMMQDVFHWFFYFTDTFKEGLFNIASRFPFPNLEGALADESILSGIRNYIALLFLRQYDLHQYYFNLDPLAFPGMPIAHYMKVRWLEGMDLFDNHVSELLDNTEVLTGLDLATTDKERLQGKTAPGPCEFITRLKARLRGAIQENLETQEISPTKYLLFQESSRTLLQDTFKRYLPIQDPKEKTKPTVNTTLSGNSYTSEKSAFADEQEAPNINFDSFMARAVATQFNGGVLYAFSRVSSVRYLLEEKDVIDGIDRMAINSDYLIISFGIDLHNLLARFGDGKKLPSAYHLYPAGNNVYIKEAIFIVKREFLPSFSFSKPADEIIKLFELLELDSTYGLYATVVDLNKNVEVRKLQKAANERDLLTKVLITIFLNCIISFDRSVKCARIEMLSPYGQQGIANKLSEVSKL